MNKGNGKRFLVAVLLIIGFFAIGKYWLYLRDDMINDGILTSAQIISHSNYRAKGGYFIRYGYQIDGEKYEQSYNLPNALPCFTEEKRCKGDSIRIMVSRRFPNLSKPLDTEI